MRPSRGVASARRERGRREVGWGRREVGRRRDNAGAVGAGSCVGGGAVGREEGGHGGVNDGGGLHSESEWERERLTSVSW
jgi:hypothetical protein